MKMLHTSSIYQADQPFEHSANRGDTLVCEEGEEAGSTDDIDRKAVAITTCEELGDVTSRVAEYWKWSVD
jgi:hypothetical protein